MEIVDRGSGRPLVLIPGVQGRWEWMSPAVDALARHARVVSYSLVGERRSGWALNRATPFDAHVDQLDAVLDQARLPAASVCGVSYGGLVALRYAARRPDRVHSLLLVSAVAPSWHPDPRIDRYTASPVRSAPAFLFGAPGRLWREIRAALPSPRERLHAATMYLGRVARYPASPVRMAHRVLSLRGEDFVSDARAVRASTLVLTGEPELDRVVPVAGTREYLTLIPGAVGRTLECTGHIGLVTRPQAFAQLVTQFIDEELS